MGWKKRNVAISLLLFAFNAGADPVVDTLACATYLNSTVSTLTREQLAQQRAWGLKAAEKLDRSLQSLRLSSLFGLRATVRSHLISGLPMVVSNAGGTHVGRVLSALYKDLNVSIPYPNSTDKSAAAIEIGEQVPRADLPVDFAKALASAEKFRAAMPEKTNIGEKNWARDANALWTAQLEERFGDFRLLSERDQLGNASGILVTMNAGNSSLMRERAYDRIDIRKQLYFRRLAERTEELGGALVAKPENANLRGPIHDESALLLFSSLALNYHIVADQKQVIAQELAAESALDAEVKFKAPDFSYADLEGLRALKYQVEISHELRQSVRKLVLAYQEQIENRVDEESSRQLLQWSRPATEAKLDASLAYHGLAHLRVTKQRPLEVIVQEVEDFLRAQIVADFVELKPHGETWARGQRLLDATAEDLKLLAPYFTTQLSEERDRNEIAHRGVTLRDRHLRASQVLAQDEEEEIVRHQDTLKDPEGAITVHSLIEENAFADALRVAMH